MVNLSQNDVLAKEVTQAIRSGDFSQLRALLAKNPGLANARVVEVTGTPEKEIARTLLHILTDWPGRFPNSGEMARELIAAGADVNARFVGSHAETPLHWAASTGDLEVMDILLDHGAEMETDGSVIGGGTPLANAVAFGLWGAARRLVERGAKTTLWQAAALGLLERVQDYFAPLKQAGDPPQSIQGARTPADEITHAFWCACHGGQLATATYLLGKGADLNWVGYDGLTPLGAARRAGAQDLVDWLKAHGAKG